MPQDKNKTPQKSSPEFKEFSEQFPPSVMDDAFYSEDFNANLT